MRIVDVHCHLASEELRGNIETIVHNAQEAGLVKLISASVTPDEWPRNRSLAQTYEMVECAWGIHPWYAAVEHLEQLDALADAVNVGVKAIGEIGLDKKIESPSFDVQQRVFERQLEIARTINLPVVLHCRGAFQEMLACVARIGLPAAGGLIHAFSGSPEIAEWCIRAGFYLSFGRSLTYRNSPKRERIVKMAYPDRFLLETDSPDMLPVEVPVGPNVPANIRYNLNAASEIISASEEDVADQTTCNANRLFKLGL